MGTPPGLLRGVSAADKIFRKGNVLLYSGSLLLSLTFGRPLSRLVRLIASNGLISLLVRFHARVPEGYDVDYVIVDAIHHLVQPVHDVHTLRSRHIRQLATIQRVDAAGSVLVGGVLAVGIDEGAAVVIVTDDATAGRIAPATDGDIAQDVAVADRA